MFDIFNIFYRITYPVNYMLQFLAKFVPGGKKLASISLAAKVALSLWIPLLIFAGLHVYWAIAYDDWTAPFVELFGDKWVGTGVVVLLCMIFPVVVYWMVRLISVERIEIFPDIDRPWDEGVAKLGEIGVDPKRTPLILVLGTDTFEASQRLHQESLINLEAKGVPAGESYFLHWYAGADAIFLHLSEVCRTSLAVRNERKSSSKESGKLSIQYSQTIGGDDLDSDYFSGETMGGTQVATLDSGSFDSDKYGGTLTGDEDVEFDSDGSLDTISESKPSTSAESSVINENKMYERLEYFSWLLRKLRDDEVPIDGVLVTVPFSILEKKSTAVDNYVHEDLKQLQENLGANFPVTIMFSEMHEVEGFVNLAAGLGSKKANASRFGWGFEIENLPTQEDLQTLAQAACDSFQKQIYETYRRQSLENIPTNKKLFSLLSRLNLGVQDRISKFLQTICISPDNVDPSDYLSLAGCYFAATGKPEVEEFAFVNGVLKKSIDSCECTNWNIDSRNSNSVYRGLAGIFSVLAAGCFIAIVYLIVTAYMGPSNV